MNVSAQQIADVLEGRKTLGCPVTTMPDLEDLVRGGIPSLPLINLCV